MADLCTVAQLRELLDLDPATGRLTWRPRGSHLFRRLDRCEEWNRRFSGQPALDYVGAHGYRVGSIFNRSVRAHRVVWAIHTGEWPTGEVDHINGDPADNRPVNLRNVGRVENGRNLGTRPTSRSGVTGVIEATGGRWRAQIKVNNRHIHLGSFASKDDAIAARKAAEREHGFHPNHGRNRDAS